MEEFIKALGANFIWFPGIDLCCGSYQIIGNPEAANGASKKVIELARKAGADCIILSCPLCQFNLNSVKQSFPIFYFTQILAIALGIDFEIVHIEQNDNSALRLLKDKNIIA